MGLKKEDFMCLEDFSEKLSKKDFLSLNDFSKKEILRILKLSKTMKARYNKGEDHRMLKGTSLAMLFMKPSTRTRVSFESGMTQLGGHALDLSSGLQFLTGMESLADTGKVLSRYVDGIMARLYKQKKIVELAEAADVPIINGLTDLLLPLQGLADMFTIIEKKGLRNIDDLKVAFVGYGADAVCHSLMHVCYKFGVDMVVACPKGYEPKKKIMKNTKNRVKIVRDPKKAVSNADVVYTDKWVSMGEKKSKERIKKFKPYQVNGKLLKRAKKDAIFMHCLPAHRGQEVTDEVIDGEHSVVLDQAENRMHTQKALLSLLLK